MKNHWYRLSLSAFGDGEGALAQGSGKTGEQGDFSADAARENSTEMSGEESREQRFQKLIGEEFKDEFTKKMQSVIDRRFKETKRLESEREALTPILSELYGKYGVEQGDIAALGEALGKERAATQESTDKPFESARAQVSEWIKQGEELKSFYPSFDLKNELSGNKGFTRLIRAGVPVRTAYEVVHKDEILGSAMEYTAKKVSEQVVKGLEAKTARPSENGLLTSGGLVRKTDVNALTSKDIMDILKQVERGAKVSF